MTGYYKIWQDEIKPGSPTKKKQEKDSCQMSLRLSSYGIYTCTSIPSSCYLKSLELSVLPHPTWRGKTLRWLSTNSYASTLSPAKMGYATMRHANLSHGAWVSRHQQHPDNVRWHCGTQLANPKTKQNKAWEGDSWVKGWAKQLLKSVLYKEQK